MEMAILHKTHLCKEIIEVGSEEGSCWGAKYQERSERNCAMSKRASKEMIFFLTLPAVEIVSVVVVVVLVAAEEKKENVVLSTTVLFCWPNTQLLQL